MRLGLDRRLAATLGAGGAVCGVSAAIAIAGAVGAKKEDAPIAITTVIIWAIVMIFVLPFAVARAASARWRRRRLDRHFGIRRCGGLRRGADLWRHRRHVPGIAGTGDQAVFAFTLMKVVGRDVWIGIWAFVLAIIATTRWERPKPAASRTPPKSGGAFRNSSSAFWWPR